MILINCNLTRADFGSVECPEVDFTNANLSHANCSRANMQRSNFCGALLHDANLQLADLRGSKHVLLDENAIAGTRFTLKKTSSSEPDIWNMLCQEYTGYKFILYMLLTSLFFVPFILEALFWYSINLLEHSGYLEPTIDAQQWQVWRVGELVLGIHESGLQGWLTLLLITYNLARWWITQKITALSDISKLSQVAPAASDYQMLRYLHRCIKYTAWGVVLLFLYKLMIILFAEVKLPFPLT